MSASSCCVLLICLFIWSLLCLSSICGPFCLCFPHTSNTHSGPVQSQKPFRYESHDTVLMWILPPHACFFSHLSVVFLSRLVFHRRASFSYTIHDTRCRGLIPFTASLWVFHCESFPPGQAGQTHPSEIGCQLCSTQQGSHCIIEWITSLWWSVSINNTTEICYRSCGEMLHASPPQRR